jgi:RNAse (barnase) inhibitor barstar
MTVAVIDGTRIGSLSEFFAEVYRELGAPTFVGHNLQGFVDCVDGLVKPPVHITWKNSGVSQRAMRKDFALVLDSVRKIKERRAKAGLEENVILKLE